MIRKLKIKHIIQQIKALSFKYRILLYIITLIFSTISLIQVSTHMLSEWISIIIYVIAAISFIASTYYIVIYSKKSISCSAICVKSERKPTNFNKF